MHKLREMGVAPYSVGLDVWLPYLYEAKRNRIYSEYILADAKYLPFRPESFEAVLSSQLIEHLDKRVGVKALLDLENITSQKIVICTPVGWVSPTDPDALSVKYQKHKTGYLPCDLTNLGYNVVGQGLGVIYRAPNGLVFSMPKLTPILVLISYSLFPVTYLLPHIAAQMIALKTMKK